ncbi:ROK family protein [Acidobacteria bacterium AB60]|nr:ROK family protein [Acidobacteria bacterium AB60]
MGQHEPDPAISVPAVPLQLPCDTVIFDLPGIDPRPSRSSPENAAEECSRLHQPSPSEALELQASVTQSNPKHVLTFDVGGSHVSSGLCRLSDLQLLSTARESLHNIHSFSEFIDLLHRLGLRAGNGEPSITGAALAVPGPFDHDAGVSLMQHKLQYLYQQDLRSALAARFGWQPQQVRFLNDAAAYLLGEIGAGAALGAERAVGITLGTGIGSAFAAHGRHLTSGPGVPPGGEIWNYPYAGATVEDLLSTRRLQTDYAALAGPNAAPREVAAIAASAPVDDHARQVFSLFGTHLGQVLRDVIAPFHPGIVVIGGGISRSASLFLPAAQAEIRGLGFRVVPSTLLDRAPLVGAAHFWREESTQVQTTSPLQPSTAGLH